MDAGSCPSEKQITSRTAGRRTYRMAGVHLLDRIIGGEYPRLATDAEVRVFEEVPYADRIAAQDYLQCHQPRRGPQSRCARDPVSLQRGPGRQTDRYQPPRFLRARDASWQYVSRARRR